MRFAIVGGGVTGLAAAWELTARGEVDVTVYEPGHLGGKLRTTEFCGRRVDEGADAMLTRVPHGVELCRELRLGDELKAPKAGRALLYVDGKARPLPEGLVLGVPGRLGPVARSGILSPAGMATALGDLVKPRSRLGDDVDVYELVSSRLGAQVADRLAEPLLGSIHAGTTRGLSAAATAPQLIAAARSRRSLVRGLRHIASPPTARKGAAAVRPPLFLAPTGGMQCLTDTLVAQLRERNVSFRPEKATSVAHRPDGVEIGPDGELYDGAVLALPAPEVGPLATNWAEESASAFLAGLRFASVAMATLAVGAGQVPVADEVSGVLVAPDSGMLVTACSFGSHKWPQWAAPGTEVLRLSVGRAGDERWAALAEEDLVARLCAEMGEVLAGRHGKKAPLAPTAWRVSRWPQAFPQFEVGHLQRVAAARAALARSAPRLALAGASYDGVGVPTCIGSGRTAAAAVWEAARARARG